MSPTWKILKYTPPPVLNSWVYIFNTMIIFKYYMYKHFYFHQSPPSAWSKLRKKFYENLSSTFIPPLSYTPHRIWILICTCSNNVSKVKVKTSFFRPLQHYPSSHVTPSQINVKYDSKVHDSWMNIHLGQLISHFKC